MARLAPIAVPASTSARISLRVMCVIVPSPMRVGILCSVSVIVPPEDSLIGFARLTGRRHRREVADFLRLRDDNSSASESSR